MKKKSQCADGVMLTDIFKEDISFFLSLFFYSMEKKFLPGRRCISMRVLSPFFLFFFQLNKQFGVKQLVEFIERKVDKSNKKKKKRKTGG